MTGASTTDIARLLARCVANYGERRNVDLRLVTAEWTEAFRHRHPASLNAALTEHIRRSTFWPTIADLEAILAEGRKATTKRWTADDKRDFCRDGRTEAEEIAYRKAMCEKWRADAAALKTPNETGI
ncbi:MAG: hypothetical protein E6Q97_32610 [Desulfurellales bacterium]|nr:MAG: hypothetical protein E6Q97_32610 [Desulfurellales bacterium]